MKVDRREVFRYLRMRPDAVDAAMAERYGRMEAAVLAAARPAARWQLQPVAIRGAELTIGPLTLTSARLAAQLAGCRRAFLFAATLGNSVDALIRRLGVTSAADQLLADAVATALIEGYCDECMGQLAAEVGGAKLRMRFSPGYGDLELATQRELLAALDAARQLGLTLSSSLLMIPTKSVSAIVGAEG